MLNYILYLLIKVIKLNRKVCYFILFLTGKKITPRLLRLLHGPQSLLRRPQSLLRPPLSLHRRRRRLRNLPRVLRNLPRGL